MMFKNNQIFNKPIVLGRTGLEVGRLGISSSYGAPAAAFEEAFERGCNYFTWNTFIKGRSKEMKTAIRNIVAQGQRDKLVLSTYDYSHSSFLGEFYFMRGLKKLGIEYADVLILGYYPNKPNHRIIEKALKLKEKGLVRFLALSGHNRKLFSELENDDIFDVYHIRYNAANNGAEKDVFPLLDTNRNTGIVTFTATRWGQLLDAKRMPVGEKPLSAAECYRFALSNQSVHVCMMAAKNREQMHENLNLLESGPLNDEEMERVRRIGAHLYNKK
jgi:predicted aldo/keto reductase-like oxidoreductase